MSLGTSRHVSSLKTENKKASFPRPSEGTVLSLKIHPPAREARCFLYSHSKRSVCLICASIVSRMIPLGINYLNKKFSFSQNHRALIWQIIPPRTCRRMKQFMSVYHLSMGSTDKSWANAMFRDHTGFYRPRRRASCQKDCYC